MKRIATAMMLLGIMASTGCCLCGGTNVLDCILSLLGGAAS